MAFDIPKIEAHTVYLDVAFSRAKKKSSAKRTSLKISDKVTKSKILEYLKIETIDGALNSKLTGIITSFPSFDNLTEFYTELVKNTIDYKALKKSLGGMNWAKKKVHEFSIQYKNKIRKSGDLQTIRKLGKEYYGRISSVMKQISKNLKVLEEARKIIRTFPSIKDGMFTVAIAGFPNIGKSTLLSKLTSAKPEIKAYSFTTKGLNVGYMKIGAHKIQFIDTPGTLDRVNKMNTIEKTAHLAIKYCAHLIIYIYDLTEPYSLKDQKKLLKNLKEFDKEIIVYLSKTDILDKKVVSEFKKKNKAITDIEALKEVIEKEFKSY